MNSWLYLAAAILLEVCATTSMKLSDGFTRVVPSVAMVVLYILSFAALTLALKKLDVSVAYAAWSGLGTAAITLVGLVLFQESMTATKAISITLIIVGVVGLNLSGHHGTGRDDLTPAEAE